MKIRTGNLPCHDRTPLVLLNIQVSKVYQLSELVSDGLSGRHYPFGKNRERIEMFLGGQQIFFP